MKIAFIGCGNMATSLMGGLIADGFAPTNIRAMDVAQNARDRIASRFAVEVYEDLETAISGVSVIAICVKPQSFPQVARAMSSLLKRNKENPLILSIAAGIRCTDIARWLDMDLAIVRAMPNTPALVQCGAAAMFASAQVSQHQKDQAESILRATGIAEWVDQEALMDVVTALSGSGPAYFFKIMESMVNASVKLGLPKQTAHLLTLQTALGAAKMALESTDDIASLREQVTSPGGTTEKGLAVMQESNIDELMVSVLQAACRRSQELADQLGES